MSGSCTVHAYRINRDGKRSFTTQTTLHRIENSGYTVRITHPYSTLYTAGGDRGLIDGIRGSDNYRLGGWQGYQGCDFEAVIDLGSVKHLSKVSAGFLQDTRAWILLPLWVEFYTSRDGKTFQKQGRQSHDVDPQDYARRILEIVQPLNTEARYVKVLARNFGTLPAWHAGAGGQAHLFIDEITLK